MASARKILGLVLFLVTPISAYAQGGLYLQAYFEQAESGTAHAQLYVYSDEGLLIHSGRGSGAHEAGQRVELQEGWYWVEVGHYRTEHNLQRLYVRDGSTTVVPSGWVSVTTTAPSEQPAGCDSWNAELTAFKVDDQGAEHLVATNRNTGILDFGMLQLPVGDFVVYFNSFPVPVTVEAGRVYRLATGYQDPVAGDRPQVSLRGERASRALVRSLCENGPTHLPSGDYWVSRIVPTNQYPYEERVRDPVTIVSESRSGHAPVRAERVGNRYAGEGSQPSQLDTANSTRLAEYRRGSLAGGRESSFDGALPSLDF